MVRINVDNDSLPFIDARVGANSTIIGNLPC